MGSYAAHISSMHSACKERIEKLEAQLTEIANIAHHGGLIGKDIKDIRGLTLPYWDMEECNRLQALRDKPCTK